MRGAALASLQLTPDFSRTYELSASLDSAAISGPGVLGAIMRFSGVESVLYWLAAYVCRRRLALQLGTDDDSRFVFGGVTDRRLPVSSRIPLYTIAIDANLLR